MSNTAKIVRFHQLGGADVLQLDELPVPTPAEGEVLIRVKAFGINRGEVMYREGHYLEQPVLPSKNGYEAAGIVEAVGPGVDGSWVGKSVSTVPGMTSLNQHGVYGEVAVVPVHAVAEYPKSLSYEEGTSIWMQYLTAYGALIMQGQITKDDFVVITAASSSVGLAAIQMVKAEGATSIAVTRTTAKAAELRKHGADHVIVTSEEDLAARIGEITGSKGARIIFDSVGGSQFETLASAAAPGGKVFLYGSLSPEPTSFPLFPAIGKALTLHGYAVVHVIHSGNLEKAKAYINAHLESGAFKPVIARTFGLADVADAHRFMEGNEQVGKIVVTV